MISSDFDGLDDGRAFDFVVVGSGFGGSVCALRLAQKGHSVAVLEAGEHLKDGDFPTTNWAFWRYLWAPKAFCRGPQRLTFLDDVCVLSGAGLGGGSLVYANTLLEPGDAFYASAPARRAAADLRERLKPHFAEARRMLGVTTAPKLFAADDALRRCAEDMGRGETFKRAEVGVYFGPEREVPDPYFGGDGPARAGCRHCGGCMLGCRHNAKNTLVKNYLPLAEKAGAKLYCRSQVASIEPLDGGRSGFGLVVKRPGWSVGVKRVRARRLVLSAGVLGTMRLLLGLRKRLALPMGVGREVRTNSELLLGASAKSEDADYSRGLAIGSGFWPDDSTHVEAVRFPEGADLMSLLARRVERGGLRAAWPPGWAKRSTILLCMKPAEAGPRLRLSLKGRRLRSTPEAASSPSAMPAAWRALERFSALTGGVRQAPIADLLGLSTTAHILGGAALGSSAQDGVCDLGGKVFGQDRLYVADGSLIPADLGVNPSLTITALAEHAMAQVPGKS